MKQLLLALAIGLTAMGCRDRETEPQDQLPPITQHGANTIGCLVNGKVLNFSKIHQNKDLSYYKRDLEGVKVRLFAYALNTNNQIGINIIFQNKGNIELNKKYILGRTIVGSSNFPANNIAFTYNGESYSTNDEYKCEIIFTKIDTISNDKYISGTFSGKVFSEGKILDVTQGRFDKKISVN